MYRAPSKNRQLARRIATYSAMTIGVTTVVTFLVFIMLGFRFNRNTSTIEQGGLVQFASRPDNATVTIGNAKLGNKTPSKITVNAGGYDVSIGRSGYQSWKKKVNVSAGEVLWLNYAQLVPNKVETKELTKFSNLADTKSSPDGSRFAVIEDSSKPVVTFVDISGDLPKQTTFTIPSNVLPEGKTPSYSIDKWANDSDRLVINLTYDTTTERLLIDRRDAKQTINLSTTYESDVSEIIFDPRSSEQLIIRTSKGEVRTINTGNDSLSGVLASNVISMSLYGNDALFFVRTINPTEQSVDYLSLGANKPRQLKRVQSTERVLVAAGNYFSDPHVAIGIGSQLDVYSIESLPSSNSTSTISMTNVLHTVVPEQPNFLSIRSSGRFVFAQYPSGVITYDLELLKQTITTFSVAQVAEVRWLDRYHFYLTTGSNLEVMEFDGGNAHSVTPLATGFDAVQSDDGTFIYSIQKLADGFTIQQSRMILK